MHAEKEPISEYSIQPMTRDDLGSVLEIEKRSFPRPWTRAMFEGEFANPVSHRHTLKVRDGKGGTLAAYIVFWVVHAEAHIMNIAVRPEMRRAGYATALLMWAMRAMQRMGAFEAYLEVRRSNAAAIELYRGLGFKESFERKNYYGDEDAIVMTREL